MAENVCLYNKRGYCKYGNTCRKSHVNEVCDEQDCSGIGCMKRHPKICVYFERFNNCKFGNFCKFSQESKARKSDIEEKIDDLKRIINNQDREILKMKNEIVELKSTLLEVKQTEDDLNGDQTEIRKKVFDCNICELSYKTKHGLNKHKEKHQNIAQVDGNYSFVEESDSPDEIPQTEESISNINTDDNNSAHKIIVKVTVSAHTHEDAYKSVRANILYILDAIIDPVHLSDESNFDLEQTENNGFPHMFVFKVILPEDIVFVDEKDVRAEWRNDKENISTQLKDVFIL